MKKIIIDISMQSKICSCSFKDIQFTTAETYTDIFDTDYYSKVFTINLWDDEKKIINDVKRFLAVLNASYAGPEDDNINDFFSYVIDTFQVNGDEKYRYHPNSCRAPEIGVSVYDDHKFDLNLKIDNDLYSICKQFTVDELQEEFEEFIRKKHCGSKA